MSCRITQLLPKKNEIKSPENIANEKRGGKRQELKNGDRLRDAETGL